MTYDWEEEIPAGKIRDAIRALLGPRFDVVGIVVVEAYSVEAAIIRLQKPYDAMMEADVWGDALGDCLKNCEDAQRNLWTQPVAPRDNIR